MLIAIKNKTDRAKDKYTVLTRSYSQKWSHCLSHLLEFFGAAAGTCLGALTARDQLGFWNALSRVPQLAAPPAQTQWVMKVGGGDEVLELEG